MRNSTRIAAASLAAGLAVSAMALPAGAAPSNKGTTYVVPSALTMSVLEGVAKPGALTDMGAAFGIVGNPKDGTIEHVGGLFVAGLKISNFTIDLTTDPDGAGDKIALVTGIVNDSFRAPLFEVGSDLTLYFTETASGAIVGSDAIAGEVAGTANIVM
jgi:hypothetical protein